MNAYEIERSPGPKYASGWCAPQHIMCELRVYRLVRGYVPEVYLNACHGRIRWARFCVLWAIVGAQMQIDAEGWAT